MIKWWSRFYSETVVIIVNLLRQYGRLVSEGKEVGVGVGYLCVDVSSES